MDINFERALTFVKNDPAWLEKLMMGAGLAILGLLLYAVPVLLGLTQNPLIIVPTLGVTLFISFFIYMVITGYTYKTGHLRAHDSEYILPAWNNLFGLFKIGMKALLGHILFLLPIILMFWLMLFLLTMIFAVHEHTIFSIFLVSIEVMALLALIVLETILGIIYYLMMSIFVRDMRITSFIDFKSAWNLLKENAVNYIVFLR